MPRRRVPSYRLHKASGQAVVTLSGRDIYLGPYGSPESEERYNRVIAEWLSSGRRPPMARTADVTVAEVLAGFMRWATEHYGPQSRELPSYKAPLSIVRKLYARTLARDFGPRQLKAVRGEMVRAGWVRTSINRHVVRIRTVFRWAASEQLIPEETYRALLTVAGLQAGRTEAPEGKRIEAVPDAIVEATLPNLTSVVRAMVEVQRLTGMRPAEVCLMRAVDIDTSGDVWWYRPHEHKNKHRGIDRLVALGPRAQAALAPFMQGRPVNAYLFSPAESEAERRAARHAKRRTPLSCGNRPGSNVKRRPRRKPGERFTTDSYNRAVYAACRQAFPPPPPLAKLPDETLEQWHKRLGEEGLAELKRWQGEHRWSVGRLRKTAATRIRKEAGLEAARVALGHSAAGVTEEHYAARDLDAVAELMKRIG